MAEANTALLQVLRIFLEGATRSGILKRAGREAGDIGGALVRMGERKVPSMPVSAPRPPINQNPLIREIEQSTPLPRLTQDRQGSLFKKSTSDPPKFDPYNFSRNRQQFITTEPVPRNVRAEVTVPQQSSYAPQRSLLTEPDPFTGDLTITREALPVRPTQYFQGSLLKNSPELISPNVKPNMPTAQERVLFEIQPDGSRIAVRTPDPYAPQREFFNYPEPWTGKLDINRQALPTVPFTSPSFRAPIIPERATAIPEEVARQLNNAAGGVKQIDMSSLDMNSLRNAAPYLIGGLGVGGVGLGLAARTLMDPGSSTENQTVARNAAMNVGSSAGGASFYDYRDLASSNTDPGALSAAQQRAAEILRQNLQSSSPDTRISTPLGPTTATPETGPGNDPGVQAEQQKRIAALAASMGSGSNARINPPSYTGVTGGNPSYATRGQQNEELNALKQQYAKREAYVSNPTNASTIINQLIDNGVINDNDMLTWAVSNPALADSLLRQTARRLPSQQSIQNTQHVIGTPLGTNNGNNADGSSVIAGQNAVNPSQGSADMGELLRPEVYQYIQNPRLDPETINQAFSYH